MTASSLNTVHCCAGILSFHDSIFQLISPVFQLGLFTQAQWSINSCSCGHFFTWLGHGCYLTAILHWSHVLQMKVPQPRKRDGKQNQCPDPDKPASRLPVLIPPDEELFQDIPALLCKEQAGLPQCELPLLCFRNPLGRKR